MNTNKEKFQHQVNPSVFMRKNITHESLLERMKKAQMLLFKNFYI